MVGLPILLDAHASHALRQQTLGFQPTFLAALSQPLLLGFILNYYQTFKDWNSSRLGCSFSCQFYFSLFLGCLIHSQNLITTSMLKAPKPTSFCKDLQL